MTNNQKIQVLSRGMNDRILLLNKVENEIKMLEDNSDFGWLMTLGAKEFGMLTAITASQQARELRKCASKLKMEIAFLKQTIQTLN